MPHNYNYNDPKFTNALVNINGFDIGGMIDGYPQISIKEIVMAESLLTPGLQTAVTIQSSIYEKVKNFDSWKNQPLTFTLTRPGAMSLSVNQQLYRLDNRSFMPTNVGQTEEFTIHACDKTTIEDAKSLVSRSWKCTQPGDVVDYVLGSCLNAGSKRIDSGGEGRDYIAENIHPFQVVSQMANMALNNDEPDFVHFMTYENQGTHYFQSLKVLSDAGPSMTFKHSEVGLRDNTRGYGDPSVVISFMFPCDFDYLSDLLNGLGAGGMNMNTLATFNPVSKMMSMLGGNSMGGCTKGYNFKAALSNQGTSSDQGTSCNIGVEKYLLKRQARMALLEKDKIALRMLVPFNPYLHAGKTIQFDWTGKKGEVIYGSGKYLISSLNHTVRFGGFSTTSLECVASTVGEGVV
jgi:hypothetical protein